MAKRIFTESYTFRIQKELMDTLVTKMNECCKKAFVGGVIKAVGYLQLSHDTSGALKTSIELKSKKLYILRKILPILKEFFDNVQISYRNEQGLKKEKTYFLEIKLKSPEHLERLKNPNPDKSCCKKAFLGACFAFNGMITYEKQYSVKIFHHNRELLNKLKRIIKKELGVTFDIYHLKKQDVLLGQGIDTVERFLSYFGLIKELLKFENFQILKEMKNKTNRLVNCETGNLKKIIKSCELQLKWINYINNTMGLSCLTPRLQEAAKLRMAYPEASLKELCFYSNGSFTKSALNHCFRKIKKIYEENKK